MFEEKKVNKKKGLFRNMNLARMLVLIVISLMTCIFFQSCSKENEEVFIDERLLVYFENFESEAQIRGLDIDLMGLGMASFIENIDDNSDQTVGQCRTYSNGDHEMVFDLDYWNLANSWEREYLVFHELGHCVLNREHLNEADQNGHCKSIMFSGNSGCKKRYHNNNRSELLDELFQ